MKKEPHAEAQRYGEHGEIMKKDLTQRHGGTEARRENEERTSRRGAETQR